MMTTLNIAPDLFLLEAEGMLIMKKKEQLKSIKLEPQLVSILSILFNHKNQLVYKESLINQVWPENPLVGKSALRRNIYKLRQLLKNHELDNHLSIETIAKKGYKLSVAKPIPNGRFFQKERVFKVLILVVLVSFLVLRIVTEEDVILILDSAYVE